MKSRSRITLALATLAISSLLSSCLLAEEAEPATEQPALASEQPALTSEDDKMLYAMGMALAQQITLFGFNEAELETFKQGLTDVALDRDAKLDIKTYGPKLQEFAGARVATVAAAEKIKSKDFIAKMAAEEGAMTKDSGLVIREITPGTGANPMAGDTVKVHYHGKLRDGKVFDSSVDRGEPATFALNQVVACWTEGVQLIKVGGKSQLTCPADIAYGDQGRPGIPGNAALTFEVELLEIVELAAPATPATPAAPATP